MPQTQLDRSQIDLSAAITAHKALMAKAGEYRANAALTDYNTHRRVYTTRAKECETVAEWLLYGAQPQ